jgi:hypothetical protein
VPVESQQPPGHEVASHTHCPLPLHSCPVAHLAQALPPEPHDAFDSLVKASQVVPPLQQPAHEAVPPHEHCPPEHESPALHAPHFLPPDPHSEPVCFPNSTHVSPLQQPVAHEVASQTHLPVVMSHSCPFAHALQLSPLLPHDVFSSEP